MQPAHRGDDHGREFEERLVRQPQRLRFQCLEEIGEPTAIDDAGNCYLGTCAPESECAAVAGCGSCAGAGEACVTYETQLGNQHHCVAIPPECNGAATCGCLGAASCLSPYRSCQEYSGIKGVICSCPTC